MLQLTSGAPGEPGQPRHLSVPPRPLLVSVLEEATNATSKTEVRFATSGKFADCLSIYPEESGTCRPGPSQRHVPLAKDLESASLSLICPFPVGSRALVTVFEISTTGEKHFRSYVAEVSATGIQLITPLSGDEALLAFGFAAAKTCGSYKFPTLIPVVIGNHGSITRHQLLPTGDFRKEPMYVGLVGPHNDSGISGVHWGPTTNRCWMEFQASSVTTNEVNRTYVPFSTENDAASRVSGVIQTPAEFHVDFGFELARKYGSTLLPRALNWNKIFATSGKLQSGAPHPAGGTLELNGHYWRAPNGECSGRGETIEHDQGSPYVWMTAQPTREGSDVGELSHIRFSLKGKDEKIPWYRPGEATLIRAYDRANLVPLKWRPIHATCKQLWNGNQLAPAFTLADGTQLGQKLGVGLSKDQTNKPFTGVMCLEPSKRYVVQIGTHSEPNTNKRQSRETSGQRYVLTIKDGVSHRAVSFGRGNFEIIYALELAAARGEYVLKQPADITSVSLPNRTLVPFYDSHANLVEPSGRLNLPGKLHSLHLLRARDCGAGRFVLSCRADVSIADSDRFSTVCDILIENETASPIDRPKSQVSINRMVGALFDHELMSVGMGWTRGKSIEINAFTGEKLRPNLVRGQEICYGVWRLDRRAFVTAITAQRFLMGQPNLGVDANVLVVCHEGELSHLEDAMRTLVLNVPNIRISFITPEDWGKLHALSGAPLVSFLTRLNELYLLAAHGDEATIRARFEALNYDDSSNGTISGPPNLLDIDKWHKHVESFLDPLRHSLLKEAILELQAAHSLFWPLPYHLRVLCYSSYLLERLDQRTDLPEGYADEIRAAVFEFLPILKRHPDVWKRIRTLLSEKNVAVQSDASGLAAFRSRFGPEQILLPEFDYASWLELEESAPVSETPDAPADAGTIRNEVTYFSRLMQAVKEPHPYTALNEVLVSSGSITIDERWRIDSALARIVVAAVFIDETIGATVKDLLEDCLVPPRLNEIPDFFAKLESRGFPTTAQITIWDQTFTLRAFAMEARNIATKLSRKVPTVPARNNPAPSEPAAESDSKV